MSETEVPFTLGLQRPVANKSTCRKSKYNGSVLKNVDMKEESR